MGRGDGMIRKGGGRRGRRKGRGEERGRRQGERGKKGEGGGGGGEKWREKDTEARKLANLWIPLV